MRSRKRPCLYIKSDGIAAGILSIRRQRDMEKMCRRFAVKDMVDPEPANWWEAVAAPRCMAQGDDHARSWPAWPQTRTKQCLVNHLGRARTFRHSCNYGNSDNGFRYGGEGNSMGHHSRYDTVSTIAAFV